MSYQRVIPRDLFNEGHLLKCYGRLWILLEGRRGVAIDHDYEAFDIQQSPDDGSLSIVNVRLLVAGRQVDLYRPLNSRHDWPLYAMHDDSGVPVFNMEGALSREFDALLKELLS